jgi:hypothetical protein
MLVPKEPASMEELPAWCRAMTRLARALYPRPNGKIRPSVGAGGTTFDIDLPRGGSGGAANIFQFALSGTAGEDGATPSVTLSYGSVIAAGALNPNGVQPYPSTLLATNTPPWSDTIPVPDDGGSWWAYLIVVIDQDPAGDGSLPPAITSIAWNLFDTTKENDPTTFTYYWPLGWGGVDGDTNAATVIEGSIGIGSQQISYVGGSPGVGGQLYWDPVGPAAIPSS